MSGGSLYHVIRGSVRMPKWGQARTTDTPSVSAAHPGEESMEAMREETQAEEQQVVFQTWRWWLL